MGLATHRIGPVRVGVSAIIACCALSATARAEDPVSFNRAIRPIFSNICFKCHGPDEGAREGKLRLDVREDALANRGGYFAIDPGNAAESEVVLRIHSTDPEEMMPPPDSGKTLTDEEKAVLTRWIQEGAVYEKHWSFVPPQRAPAPSVSNPRWVRNPIDAFVLARLDEERLRPSPQADEVTLLRRLHLDITGLPPTVDEIDAFLEDDRKSAYDNAVNRLLDSPHFGERWARPWLDAAQYADSDGFEKDKPRQVWAWRDWVINALNDNMPYDQFVTEQIAGDLLPGATQDEIVATGFLRNSMINEEGGIDPEQFRMEALFNRMDVIGRAVLGLTVQCAQCHTHKYDPLTHTDYYRMLAYINSSHEAQMTVYTPEENAQRDAVRATLEKIDSDTKAATPDWQVRLNRWADELRAEPAPEWSAIELVFDDTSSGGQKFMPAGVASFIAQGYAPTRFGPKMAGASPLRVVTAVRLELLNDPNLPRNGPGRSIYGASALSEFEMRVEPQGGGTFDKFDDWQRVELASAVADVNPAERVLGPEFPDKEAKKVRHTGPVAMAIDGNNDTAWSIDAGPGRTNQPRYAVFQLAKPLKIAEGTRIGFRLGQHHGGYNSDDNQTNNIGRFRLSVTESKVLPSDAIPFAVSSALAKPEDTRTAEESDAVFRYWRNTQPDLAAFNERAEAAWREYPWGATQLVYDERATQRETHRLERGDFLQPAEAVAPGVPEFLNTAESALPPDRRGLAAWLVDRDSPTTARAYVNRIWQGYFGEGIVATPSDFGLQGESPSHPELLDWLAVEFMDSGWDIKHVHRLIVSSATYRQSSRATDELLERDPKNRLLARGSRYRVDGEIVRDIALAASGLLDPAIGGPSVYPPAPEFLFMPPASYGPKTWITGTEDQYRRALYTFRFRSVPYPALQVFDTPPGDAPCIRRERSNTPLQALTMLNEPLFVECAVSLAREAIELGGASDADRIAYAFRRCTARTPARPETKTLAEFLDAQRSRIAAGELDPAAILGEENDDAELAAWALTARVILNMDETITRE